MQLDRTQTADGTGKYAVINLRKLRVNSGQAAGEYTTAVQQALETLAAAGALEMGRVGHPGEFFVLKLADRHTKPALQAYAHSVRRTDPAFAADVVRLSERAA